MSRKYQETGSFIKLWLCTLLTIAGCALLFIGMFIEPEGEIHHTVLMASGEVFVFAGSLAGVAVHYDLQLKQFASKITQQLDEKEKEKEKEA